MAMFSKVSAPAPAAFRSTAVLFSVIAYSACSSTMLIVNKFAIRELPVPTLVRRVECSVRAKHSLVVLSLARVHAAARNSSSPVASCWRCKRWA
jgi:hypothetical protein